MKIVFERLSFKNIFSYGNRITEFNFKNGIDLVVGSNGNGKSTFVDALTYCLFGKPFRKTKLGNLINDKNMKGLWVEIIFTANGNRFKIIRGQKPYIFEIYKEEESGYNLVEKPSTNREYQTLLESDILQFGENVFRQLIALGANLSSSKNFMDLSKSEKEEVLQVITDTAIFNLIKEKVREKKLHTKTMKTEYDYKLEVQRSSISSAKINISAMERQNEDFNKNKDSILKELREERDRLVLNLSKYPRAFEALDKLEIEKEEKEEEVSRIEEELKPELSLEQDLKSKSLKFIANEKNKTICPNCNYEIKEHLDYDSDYLKRELKSVKERIQALNDKKETILKELNDIISKLNNRERLKNNERDTQNSVYSIEKRIEETSNWETVEIDYSELKRLENEYEETKKKSLEINNSLTDLNELEELASDRHLKGVILDQQLPFLNKYVNEFLELFDSKFNFVIDSEFKEKIISRNSDNDFNALSNGQKQRISLSILFAFLRLIEEKNGISTNILILDEYLDSSLDIEGIDEVMNILDEVFSDKKDIILISHNPDIKNRLELLNRIITVKSEEGFSIFEVENNS